MLHPDAYGPDGLSLSGVTCGNAENSYFASSFLWSLRSSFCPVALISKQNMDNKCVRSVVELRRSGIVHRSSSNPQSSGYCHIHWNIRRQSERRGSVKQRKGIVGAKIDLYCKTLSLGTILTLFQCKLAVPSNVRVIPRQVDRHKIELSICYDLSFKFLWIFSSGQITIRRRISPPFS